ncbi:hypothetical protein [Micromonospora sp. URMC 103]|uniref:hypothetical protein n=1 Tax=Micromonospora sp. URMC 103 TaxID=3423406 RepID=UPI003F1E00A4
MYGFRFLEPMDPPDIAGGLENLADDVEELLADKQPRYGRGELPTAVAMTASITDLPGAEVTINSPRAGAVAFVSFAADLQLTSAGAGNAFVLVSIDGVDQPANAVWNPATLPTGARCTVANAFPAVLIAAGNHTFKLRGQGPANIRANNIHTNVSVLVLP